ncbi:MAG: TolC family protein [Planctomycetota bacterium]
MATRRRCARAGALVVFALGSCQTYAPEPLDLDAHRAAWHARDAADAAAGEPRPLAPAPTAFDVADGLTLDEGRLVALAFHPELRLARLRVGRAEASAEHAGRWADPTLGISALRVADDVPDPWILAPQLTLPIPISGRLGVERARAAEARKAELAVLREAEWRVWRDVRVAWSRWSALRLRAEESERLVRDLTPLAETASRLAASGELSGPEATLFALGEARHAAHARRLRGEARAAELALLAELGLAPEADVRLLPALPAAPDATAGEELPAWAAERNPTLARLRAEHRVAEETLRREIRAQIPDLTLGPQYESEQGQSRPGLWASIPLPLFNANRQAIAVARAERELARAAFEVGYERLAGRWSAAAARAAALAAQRADFERALQPLLDVQTTQAAELLRLGEASALVLLESLVRAHEIQQERIDARLAQTLVWAELEHLGGPPAEEEDSR